jgi:hypothetical protein
MMEAGPDATKISAWETDYVISLTNNDLYYFKNNEKIISNSYKFRQL